MAQAAFKIHPIDVIGARLDQANAVVTALTITYDSKDGAFDASPKILNDALWAVTALLEQGQEAFQELLDERDGERVVKMRRQG